MENKNNQMTNYGEAVETIKVAILQSQYMAAKAVNSNQLSLYYGVGQYVSQNSRKGFWGTSAIENISRQLQKELPGLRGSLLQISNSCANFMKHGVRTLNRLTGS